MSKYQVGETVTIRKDLEALIGKEGKDVVRSMLPYAGKTVTIKKAEDNECAKRYGSTATYYIEEYGWNWYDHCFEEKTVVIELTHEELNCLYLALGDQTRMSMINLEREEKAERGNLRYGIGERPVANDLYHRLKAKVIR